MTRKKLLSSALIIVAVAVLSATVTTKLYSAKFVYADEPPVYTPKNVQIATENWQSQVSYSGSELSFPRSWQIEDYNFSQQPLAPSIVADPPGASSVIVQSTTLRSSDFETFKNFRVQGTPKSGMEVKVSLTVNDVTYKSLDPPYTDCNTLRDYWSASNRKITEMKLGKTTACEMIDPGYPSPLRYLIFTEHAIYFIDVTYPKGYSIQQKDYTVSLVRKIIERSLFY